MSQEDIDRYGIKPCSCGEKEFLQVLKVTGKYGKPYVHCVNCGNRGLALSTEEKAVDAWNKTSRLKIKPEN